MRDVVAEVSAFQSSLFAAAPLDNFEPAAAEPAAPSAWRDYETDPVPHIRHLPVREQLKRCAARFAYAHRYERCPRTEDIGDEHREITWGEWFWIRHNQTLDDYMRQIKHAAVAASTENQKG